MIVEDRATVAETAGLRELRSHPLFETMTTRRARRFALGNHLQGGASWSYESTFDPRPLSLDEQAALVWAGAGVTGRVFGELPYVDGDGPETGGGQIMMGMVGRTHSSADAVATATLMVTSEDGTYLMPRPTDLPLDEFDRLAAMGRESRYTEIYEQTRIRIAEARTEIPRVLPFTPPFNKWSSNVPGTTHFVPITDTTGLYMTILFAALGEEFAYFFHDDKDRFLRKAGIAQFGRSKGGHLYDDVKDGRVGTIDEIETYNLEICGFEQGLMIQNLALATEAMGLGGFPHYGAHRFGWLQSLGFEMRERRFSEITHQGILGTMLMKLLGKDVGIPQAINLFRDGQPLFKPWTVPFYPTMEDAVRAFVDFKFAGGQGFFRDPRQSAWKDPKRIQEAIPPYSEANIKAVIAYCNWVMDHYGQFPGNYGPFRTLMAFQAHHIDTAFYDRFYVDGAYTDLHDRHFELWHAGEPGVGA